jgi:hypothetical protein
MCVCGLAPVSCCCLLSCSPSSCCCCYCPAWHPSDVYEICRNLHLPGSSAAAGSDLVTGSHHTVWMGDLNYRLEYGQQVSNTILLPLPPVPRCMSSPAHECCPLLRAIADDTPPNHAPTHALNHLPPGCHAGRQPHPQGLCLAVCCHSAAGVCQPAAAGPADARDGSRPCVCRV